MKAAYKEDGTIDDTATGERARRERMSFGISQRKISKVMGYSSPFVSDLENGYRRWTEDKVLEWNAAIKHLIKTTIEKGKKNSVN